MSGVAPTVGGFSPTVGEVCQWLVVSLSPPALPAQTGDDGDPIWLGLAALVVGLVVIYAAFRRYRQRRLMEDTPTSEIRSLAVGSVELWGEIVPHRRVLDQPLADGDCVVVHYRIERYEHHRRDDEDHYEWRTIRDDVDAVPFYLEDETGRVLVDPSNHPTLDISGANRTQLVLRRSAGVPDDVAAYLEAHPGAERNAGFLGFQSTNVGDHRFTQEVLVPDDRAYVFGDAEPRGTEQDTDRLVVCRDEDTEMFLLSDKTEDQLVAERRWVLPVGVTVGLALSGFGLWVILTRLGV